MRLDRCSAHLFGDGMARREIRCGERAFDTSTCSASCLTELVGAFDSRGLDREASHAAARQPDDGLWQAVQLPGLVGIP